MGAIQNAGRKQRQCECKRKEKEKISECARVSVDREYHANYTQNQNLRGTPTNPSIDWCSKSLRAFRMDACNSFIAFPSLTPNRLSISLCQASYLAFTRAWTCSYSMIHTPNDFCVPEVSNVERALLISVKSCCQCARESPNLLNTYSASRSHNDWNCSHLATYSLSCWTLVSIKAKGRSNVASGNRVN